MVCRMFRWDVPLRFCNNRYLHQTIRSCYGSDADAPRDLAEYSATSIVRHRNRENRSASDDLLLVLHCLFCCAVLIWLGTFNTYIIELIYGLPTFEQLDYDGPPHLTWDIRMSKSMVAGLIHYKMKSEPHTRPLTSEIRETLQLIESIPGLGDTTGYNEALVQLAAEALPLSEVIGRLSARSYKTAYRSSILENALVAALYQNQISHIETILACGARPHRRTYSFGEPIAVAACYAGLDSLYLVVQKASLLKDELCDKLVASRLLAALEKAAGKGRSDIFAKGMPVLIDIVGPGEPRYLFYTTALSSAILAGHGHVVDTITDILNKDDYLFTSRDDHASWLQLARLASSENYEDVLAIAIKFSSKADLTHEMEKLLGDACRQGHVNIVDMLMTNVEPHLDWYTNAVYWAARNAHWKVLAHLNSRDPRVGSQCITTALCGASMCGKSGTTQVLRTIDTWHKLTEAVENFDGAYFSVIDELLKDRDQTELLSRHISVTSRQLRLKEQEAYVDQWWPPPNLPLRKACASGDISFVHDEIKNDPSQGAGISTRYVGCFSTAIEFNHPGILLYLCQKMSHSRSFNYGPALRAKSIAIFQVMLDTGWDINEVQSKIHSSSLGSVTESEQLTRWFLDHDADPNQRCDWDHTPFSTAVIEGSLSTISLMVQRGADIRKGQVLHFAVERILPGQLAIIDWLVGSGAPVNSRKYEDDPQSWADNEPFGLGTPLHRAADLENVMVVKLLLHHGADPRILDTAGRTAYDLASNKGNEVIMALLDSR